MHVRQCCPGHDDARDVRQLPAQIATGKRLPRPGRAIQQDAASYWHMMRLEQCAFGKDIDDIAPQHLANLIVDDDVIIVHALVLFEQHPEPVHALDVTVLVLHVGFIGQCQELVAVDRCSRTLPHDGVEAGLGHLCLLGGGFQNGTLTQGIIPQTQDHAL